MKDGIRSHENRGPQHAFMASLKFPSKYFFETEK
jgi:hypothetical protein